MSRSGKRRLQMARFVEGEDRSQVALLPECLDDFVDEDNAKQKSVPRERPLAVTRPWPGVIS
jgi:hypothetical protein